MAHVNGSESNNFFLFQAEAGIRYLTVTGVQTCALPILSGGPITLDQTTAEYYATIFALAESPRVKGLIWVGSDDGLVHITRDGGKTWQDVTPRDLGPATRISGIEASHYAPGAAYLAANRIGRASCRERV